jgi:hypothetical protein
MRREVVQFAKSIRLKRSDMWRIIGVVQEPKRPDLSLAISCPTCDAPVDCPCKLGTGSVRSQSHVNRRLAAPKAAKKKKRLEEFSQASGIVKQATEA